MVSKTYLYIFYYLIISLTFLSISCGDNIIEPQPLHPLQFVYPCGNEEIELYDTVNIQFLYMPDSVSMAQCFWSIDNGKNWYEIAEIRLNQNNNTVLDTFIWIPGKKLSSTDPDIQDNYVILKLCDYSKSNTFAISHPFFILQHHSDKIRVDNRNEFLPPVIKQSGKSCGNIAGVYYVYTYEMNCKRNSNASDINNQYPFCFTYHFLNSGDPKKGSAKMYQDAWDIIKENGIPTVTDFGGALNGYPTRWMSGYSSYYSGMKNRIDNYFCIEVNSVEDLTTLKQWLRNHDNGSTTGGICAITMPCDNTTMNTISDAAQCNKIITDWGETPAGHAMVIVGYDDTISYDGNNDGKCTRTIDITGDGIVDIQDCEFGVLLLLDPFGSNWGDKGFAYTPYNSLFRPKNQGGINGELKAYGIHVNDTYSPSKTFKIVLTHNCRNKIRIIPGFSDNAQDTIPRKQIYYSTLFSYSGGALPMQGNNLDSTIEIGLDVSNFSNSTNADTVIYFLDIESKGGNGMLKSFSHIDYTTAPIKETVCVQNNVKILSGLTRLRINVIRD